MKTEIQLTNFQAHEKTELKLRDGLVCIVGPTNVGKSSVVRAIRWLMYDSLRGVRHIRKGQDTAFVTLKLDGVSVQRVKGKQGNRYRLNETWFDAVGVGTPPEVGKALQVVPVKVDKDNEVELNVSMQLNPPFLILETDSTRAKFLNVLTGGHVIDATVRETSRVARGLEDARKIIRATLEQADKDLKTFDGLAERERKVQEIKASLDILVSKQELLDKLTTHKNALMSIRQTRERVATKLSAIRIGNVEANLQKINLLINLQQWQMTITTIRQNKTQVQSSMQQFADTLKSKKEAILKLPDFECDSCGQVVTQAAREKQLVTA